MYDRVLQQCWRKAQPSLLSSLTTEHSTEHILQNTYTSGVCGRRSLRFCLLLLRTEHILREENTFLVRCIYLSLLLLQNTFYSHRSHYCPFSAAARPAMCPHMSHMCPHMSHQAQQGPLRLRVDHIEIDTDIYRYTNTFIDVYARLERSCMYACVQLLGWLARKLLLFQPHESCLNPKP